MPAWLNGKPLWLQLLMFVLHCVMVGWGLIGLLFVVETHIFRWLGS